MLDITKNLQKVHDDITGLMLQNKRSADDVRLIAVSKTQAIESIELAYQAGQRDFAENYLQEAEEKIRLTKAMAPDIIWHYIGQLQSNKCTRIAEHFAWVHSLSSLKHAQRLNDARAKCSDPLMVCVQVSLEKKIGRNGIVISELKPFLAAVHEMTNLQMRGLMCVLPADHLGEQAYTGFMQIKNSFDSLKKEFPTLDTLSMGMSGDYAQAIRAGSTMLRLGSAIFGQREYTSKLSPTSTENLL